MTSPGAEIDRIYGFKDREGRAFLWDTLAQLRRERRATFRHCIRLGRLARDFARYLGASELAAKNLGLAAACHDVGKLCIPFEILDQTDKPTDEERAIISSHARHGGTMLAASSRPLAKLAAGIAEHHHVSSRDRGVLPGEISLGRDITSLCDFIDASVSFRPYRKTDTVRFALKNLVRIHGADSSRLLEPFALFCLGAFRKRLETEQAMLKDEEPLTPEYLKERLARKKAKAETSPRRGTPSPPARGP